MSDDEVSTCDLPRVTCLCPFSTRCPFPRSPPCFRGWLWPVDNWICIHAFSFPPRARLMRGKKIAHSIYRPGSIGPTHRWTKPGRFETYHYPLSHELRSEWVSDRADKWAQCSAWEMQEGRSKWMSEQISEWLCTYVPILGCAETLCNTARTAPLLTF